jgi:hypothetical protein
MNEPEPWVATYDHVLAELAAQTDREGVESAIEASQAALARSPDEEERMFWTVALRVLEKVLLRCAWPSATIH